MAKLCSCTKTTSPPIPGDPKCKDNNCIYAPHLLIKGTAEDSVTKCGETGVINILDEVGIAPCTKNNYPVNITIVKKSGLVNTAVYVNGEIRFTLKDTEDAFGTIKYKVSCGKFGRIGEIMILPYIPCAGVICTATQRCDVCTGNCISLPPEIAIKSNKTPEIRIK